MKILLKTNTTIEENEFGICIRSIINGVCDRKKYFSSINDNYYIGIQLDSYDFLKDHYERFLQKKNIVIHNKRVSMNDSRYLNEYQRESKALSYYVEKTVLRELKLLEEDIKEFGVVDIIEKHPKLQSIIANFDKIKEELYLWKRDL